MLRRPSGIEHLAYVRVCSAHTGSVFNGRYTTQAGFSCEWLLRPVNACYVYLQITSSIAFPRALLAFALCWVHMVRQASGLERLTYVLVCPADASSSQINSTFHGSYTAQADKEPTTR